MEEKEGVGGGWLYSAEAVAKVQSFFGLECVRLQDGQTENQHPLQNKTDDNFHHKKNEIVGQTNGVIRHRSDGALGSTSSPGGSAPPAQPGTSSPTARMGDPDASLRVSVSYRVHNKFWFHLFAFAAALGDDVFYFTFYPFWFFNLSPWVIRRVILMWGMLMYVGQASKELLNMPRPSAPPVAPLEKRYFQEYGMPSTHAMVGTLIPFTILVVTWDKIEYPPLVGILLASSWTLLVCLSRLYKGMHYILDIIAGVLLTVILMLIAFQFLDGLDEFLITHPYAPLFSIATALFLALVYPTKNGRSSTRADTVVIMACTTAIYSHIWLAHRLGLPPRFDELPSRQIAWPDVYGIVGMMVREVVGVGLMGLVYFTFKFFTLGFLSIISGREITQETKKETWVEIPYKFITYFGVCSASNYLAPITFEKLGI